MTRVATPTPGHRPVPPPRPHAPRRAALWLSAACTLPALGQADPAAVQQVEVVGRSPLPGLGVARDLLPYATTVVQRPAIDRAQADTLAEHLARQLPGLQVNDIQGSPYQGDVTFRGQRASGLLGAAQGLSVYLDGVRINEPFGDVVNWDLLPEVALRSVTLVPGANPAFGLNTLGGAIALQTASGRSDPGVRADIGLGSSGRRRADASLGGSGANGWHHYVAGTAFDETGWRDHSPGRLGLVFAKLGQARAGASWDLGLLAARSRLVGNGLVPALTVGPGVTAPDLLASRRSAVFTHPDRTRNQLLQLALNAQQTLPGGAVLQLLAYTRHGRRGTVNGDLGDEPGDRGDDHDYDHDHDHDRDDGGDGGDGGVNASERGPTAPAAALNTTRTRQHASGIAASLSGGQAVHHWQLGATLDRSRVHYRQDEQAGRFDATRGVVAGDEGPALSAEVRGRATHLGLYATDTWRLGHDRTVTATLRWNHSRVGNTLTTVDDDTGQLRVQPDERFRYRSLNPALGLVQVVAPGLSAFANVSRNARVPTVIELGCADPEQPCRLPAGLQSDPYLRQVRATGLEAGLRWTPQPGQRVELSLYRNDNRDDILFSSISRTGQLGYFRNFERTRHQGLDLTWQRRTGPLGLALAYGRLDATYQADGTLRIGARNVPVRPGMRMAGLPRHSLKLSADLRLAGGWSLGGDVQAVSRRVSQGNEDGRVHDADDAGTRDLSLPGHALVHLRAAWQATPTLELVARVGNLFDRASASYGALATTPFDAQGRPADESRDALFVAPGAPRRVFVGLRWRP